MYRCYKFTVSPPDPGSEIVLALLSELPFDTFEITPTGLNAYCNEQVGSELDIPDFSEYDFSVSYNYEFIPFQNWNAKWEASFEPIQIDQVYIHAQFHKPNQQCLYNICITPKMSFGTGHHHTTRSMCKIVQRLNIKGHYVWDIGTGTGILAILSKQLGAQQVDATDTEFSALENALENASTNRTQDIHVYDALQFKPQNQFYDLILANINKNVLKHYAASCALSIKQHGQLIISGFFETDTDDLKSFFKTHGFEAIEVVSEHEWAAIHFIKTL